MNNIFTLTNNRLTLLDAKESVKLFQLLLWAEATRIGLPLSQIETSLRYEVPDEGIDASVTNAPAKITESGLIKSGKTSYQIKTGSDFKPWQSAKIRIELFGKRKKVELANLGDAVKACLDENGTYVLVCFGVDLTPQQSKETAENLRALFKQCKYTDPRVEVWGQSTIAGLINRFPSLVLDLNGFNSDRFKTHKSWSAQDDMRKEYKAGDEQLKVINAIRNDLLRNDNDAVHVHISAEAGAGKTRLVLEATSSNDLRPLVVYFDSPSKIRNSDLMNQLIRSDNQFCALLVVDECDSKNRAYIWNDLKGAGSQIKLVTIYNELEESSGNIAYFDAPLLESDQISAIIQTYQIPKFAADSRVDLCGGSPRAAHILGSALAKNPDDLLLPLDTVDVWDRWVVIGSDDPTSEDVKQRRLVLQYLALFYKFGIAGSFKDEAIFIAEMIQKANPQITKDRFFEIIAKLNRRKILQGEYVLYITPKLLHIKLWKDWWEDHRYNFDYEEFVKGIPDSLLNWFFQMFRYAKESNAAKKIVKQLLSEDGPFRAQQDLLKTRFGSDFFLILTEGDPEAALKSLKRIVDEWSTQEKYRLLEPRRGIVWALEKMAVWKELFQDAARLLLDFAEAENESYGNNASGTFISLFSPAPAPVAPTEASPEERFSILVEAVNSDSKNRRLLGFKACSAALQTDHFSRIGGFEYQGLREAKLWRPQSREEILTAYVRVWQFLFSILNSVEEEERKIVLQILLEHARGLSRDPELGIMVSSDITALSTKPDVDKSEILKAVERIVLYSKNELPSEITKRWKELRNKLVGNDFTSQMKRYVGMNLLEDSFDEDGKPIDKAATPIRNLVQQVLENNELLKIELPWLLTDEAKNAYRFGYELGQQDKNFKILPALVEGLKSVSGKQNASDFFLGGYIKAVFEKDPDRWEIFLDSIAKDESLARFVPSLTWRSGMTSRAALRVLNMARQGLVNSNHFAIFAYGSVLRDLPKEIFDQWIDYILDSSEESAVSIALTLHHYFYGQKDSNYSYPKESTLRILTNPFFFTPISGQRHQMEDFYWTEIAKAYIENYPEESLIIADLILQHFGEEGTIAESYHFGPQEVLNHLAIKHPEALWKKITTYLGPPIDGRSLRLTYWLRGDGFGHVGAALPFFEPELVWKWVDEDVERRASYLATFVPKDLFSNSTDVCWTRELLVRYGERQDVRKALAGNYYSDGWTGRASIHYEEKKNRFLSFKKSETDRNVIKWVDEVVESLEKQIEREKMAEEREFRA